MKFTLQRFANESTRANIASVYIDAQANTTLAGLTPEMKEFYSNMLVKEVGPSLIHAQFGEKETLPKGHGNLIEWRKWSKFAKATTPLTEGVTPAATTLTVSPIRKTLNQYGAWSCVTDLLSLEAIDNVIVEYTARHSENAKLTLDTITRNELIAGISHELLADGVDSISKLKGKITTSDVARIATELKKKNAPKFDNAYVMIIHPSVAYDLMTSADWIDVQKYSNATAIFNGEIGKLYGVRFVESTEAKVNKAKVLGNGTAGKCTSAKVVSYSSAQSTYTITVADNTFVADELNNKKIYIHDVSETGTKIEEATVSDTTTNTIVLSAAPTMTPAAGDIIYLSDSENALDGADYFTCIALGKGAYKTVNLDNGNVEVIVKPLGAGDDPLNQRSSIGAKCNGYACGVVLPDYALKYYCVASVDADAND